MVRDYPTLAQLRQVLQAEQERLAGQPRAALARLRPLGQDDTALVAVHWAMLRVAQSAGDAATERKQLDWLADHRGRVFAESTTSDVLRFFNIAVSVHVAPSADVAARR